MISTLKGEGSQGLAAIMFGLLILAFFGTVVLLVVKGVGDTGNTQGALTYNSTELNSIGDYNATTNTINDMRSEFIGTDSKSVTFIDVLDLLYSAVGGVIVIFLNSLGGFFSFIVLAVSATGIPPQIASLIVGAIVISAVIAAVYLITRRG